MRGHISQYGARLLFSIAALALHATSAIAQHPDTAGSAHTTPRPANTSQAITGSSTSTAQPSSGVTAEDQAAVIAGVSVGAALLLLLVFLAFKFILTRRSKRPMSATALTGEIELETDTERERDAPTTDAQTHTCMHPHRL